MKEKERKIIVDSIHESLAEINNLNHLENELELLKKDPKIQQYIYLNNKVNSIKSHGIGEESRSRLIYKGFNYAYIKNKDKLSPCEHDTWLYLGSYYLTYNALRQKEYKKCFSENLPGDFISNKYICLDCGKVVDEKDWEKFEEEHHVLKNQNSTRGIYDYLSSYYQLLYTHPADEALDIFMRLFGFDEQQKVLTKNKASN